MDFHHFRAPQEGGRRASAGRANFVDEDFAEKFGNEKRIGTLAAFFAILAILISCLGLFGLASFVAEQRTKEIGIRKVLGASVTNLWRMLSRDFVVLVILSCLISIPLAWPSYVAVSDRWAYVADTVNRRVVRIKLAYAAETTCAAP